ncbi:MAG: ring-opening amidohydrolase [Pseudomonadota bacterium]
MFASSAAQRQCLVFRVPAASPADMSGVARLMDDGRVRAEEILAIFGKTEGNGCVNDFTRGYAVDCLKLLFAARLDLPPDEAERRIAMIMSGGTEGGLSPHFLVFAVTEQSPLSATGHNKALAIGRAATRRFLPEEIGRMAQVEATADAVRQCIDVAGIDEVHFVQIKCPLLTAERIAEASARRCTTVTDGTYASMGYSRGASALGTALALGEVDQAALSDEVIGRNANLWSARASISAGVELLHNEIIVLGNSETWSGSLTIAHAVMQDALDAGAVRAALEGVGIAVKTQIAPADQERLLAVLVKAEPSRSGTIRGLRHIMGDDSDINATRHARALVGGVVGGVIGRTDLFVSGGAEHQGPDGGGPIAVIASR